MLPVPPIVEPPVPAPDAWMMGGRSGGGLPPPLPPLEASRATSSCEDGFDGAFASGRIAPCAGVDAAGAEIRPFEAIPDEATEVWGVEPPDAMATDIEAIIPLPPCIGWEPGPAELPWGAAMAGVIVMVLLGMLTSMANVEKVDEGAIIGT